MNLKKFLSFLFVLLLGVGSLSFAANNTRNVYSVFSDSFNGIHFDAPSSDTDSVSFMLWSDQSMTGETMSDTPAEGQFYSKLTNGEPDISHSIWKYGGGGFVSTNSNTYIDMSAYDGGSIKFFVRSSDSNMTNMKVGIKLGTREIMVTLASLGFTANGQWQELTFPLTTATSSGITATSLANTSVLFIFNLPEANYVVGESVCFDNIRWIKNNAGATFSIVRKNTSDNSEVSDQTAPISFSEDYYGQGWVVADQYIEMDIDGEFTGNNWVVRVCTNNNINGLYNVTDTTDVLPTAWKVSCSTLPYTYVDGDGHNNRNTLEIGENISQSGEFFGLYDAGKVAYLQDEGVKWLYPWFFVKAAGDTSDQSIILNDKGCHTFENTDAGGVVHQYYDGLTGFYERKPKLFFACDTKNAIAAQYTASFTISLSYE